MEDREQRGVSLDTLEGSTQHHLAKGLHDLRANGIICSFLEDALVCCDTQRKHFYSHFFSI